MINDSVNNQKQTTAVFAALVDPTRRRILLRLHKGSETRVNALVKPFRVSAPAISRHLRILERAKLIERRREGRMHFIRARPDGLREAERWIAACAAGWNFSLDALDRLIHNQQKQGKESA